MHTLWNDRDRQQLLDRLARLTPDRPARWGRMNAPQMVTHLSEAMRMALGELPCRPKNVPWRHAPIKQLVVYWLPWPKGVPTARELLGRTPLEWPVERAAVRRHVESFQNLDPKLMWPEHPAFGKLTPKAWCVLGYRHMDHHLRQFGI